MSAARWLVWFLVFSGVCGVAHAEGTSGRTHPPACGPRFTVARPVGARKATLGDTGVNISVPVGWSWEAGVGGDGSPVFRVSAPSAGPQGVVILGASDQYPDRPLAELATESSHQLVGARIDAVVTSRNFSLGGRCGFQTIFRTAEVEGYVALVRNAARVYILAAKYPQASSALMRAGLDTMVASVELPAPNATTAVSTAAAPQAAPVASVTGCWDARLDDYSSRRLNLYGNGRYQWTYEVGGLPDNPPPRIETGRYVVRGGALVVSADGGQTESYELSISQLTLALDGRRYIRCD